MGAKYLPTIKDQKAALRFQQKQAAERKLKQQQGGAAAKKGKQK